MQFTNKMSRGGKLIIAAASIVCEVKMLRIDCLCRKKTQQFMNSKTIAEFLLFDWSQEFLRADYYYEFLLVWSIKIPSQKIATIAT